MNVQEYIASGVVQDYCLGVLSAEEMKHVEMQAEIHAEIQDEIFANQQALEAYAMQFAEKTPIHSKANLFANIDNLIKERTTSIEDLPLLNKYSDYKNWLQAVQPLLPEQTNKEMVIKVLREDDKVVQLLIWTKVNYPDEMHDDLQESFIVLQGECECYIGDDIYKLGPGGFLEIPMYSHHDVKVTKGPVLAVVQRLKVA